MTKRNQKTYEYRGESFPSLMSLADKFSVNYWNLIRRIKSGWTIQQAMGDSPKPIRKAHNSLELKTSIGTFNSVRDASIATGIAEGTLASRLRKNWSPDEAIGIKRHKTRHAGNNVVCEGRVFLSVFHFADSYNKSRTRIHKRLASGWTPEEAVDIAPRPPRFRNQEGAARDHMWTDAQLTDTGAVLPKTEIGNYRLYSIREKSTGREYVGITTGDLKARLRGHWRMVKIGRKSKLYNRMRKALAQGRKKDFEIMLLRNDARDFVELQEQEINAIRERGTIEMGFNTGKGGSIGTSKQIKISQMVFPSHQAAADHFQIDSYKFSIRLNRLGWSPEEAAGLTGRGAKSREVTCLTSSPMSQI